MDKSESMAMNWMAGWTLIYCSLVFLICYLIDPLLAVLSTIPLTIMGFISILSAVNYIKTNRGVEE